MFFVEKIASPWYFCRKTSRGLRCKTPHMGRVAEKQTHVSWRLQDAERRKFFQGLRMSTTRPYFKWIWTVLIVFSCTLYNFSSFRILEQVKNRHLTWVCFSATSPIYRVLHRKPYEVLMPGLLLGLIFLEQKVLKQVF